MNFSRRSYQKELLDRSDIPSKDIKLNMEELELINKYLGGHKITTEGMKSLFPKSGNGKHGELVICEVGCGGGDNILAIEKWLKQHNLTARFICIDINPYCIEVAMKKLAGTNASFMTSDYIKTVFGELKPDYIFSSLFCHHFTDEELIRMIEWMQLNAKSGFFFNDLHRHRLAYYSIKLLTMFFSKSYLVKNDAPLSVLRGFRKKEWQALLKAADIRQYSIQWKWAFRHLITVTTSADKTN